jgi:hypothetical protein
MTMRKESLPEKPTREELAKVPGLKERVGSPVHASEAIGGGFLISQRIIRSVNSIQVVDSFPHFLGCFASQSRVICCAFISCSGVNFVAVASLYCALFV